MRHLPWEKMAQWGCYRRGLKLDSSSYLDATGRTDRLIPTAKVFVTDVIVERETRSLVVYVGCIEKVMLVESVEELEAQLEVHALT